MTEHLIGIEGDVATPDECRHCEPRRIRQRAPVLSAPLEDLERAVQSYLSSLPSLADTGGAYVFINGPLARSPMFGTGLVSIASAAQAMLARVLMQEMSDTGTRINELVIYSAFGWGDVEQRNTVTGEDIGLYVAYLVSDAGAEFGEKRST